MGFIYKINKLDLTKRECLTLFVELAEDSWNGCFAALENEE